MENQGLELGQDRAPHGFLTQAPLLFITSLPAQLGIWASEGGRWVMGPVAWVGVAIAMIGIVFETVGDAQLKAFRAQSGKQGQGARHRPVALYPPPQLFRRCLHLVGYLAGGGGNRPCWLGEHHRPDVPDLHLTKWSGKPLLERSLKKNRPDYAAYIERTSGFFPWPPKK
jgi:steroid 5-alpha reductase family enzyme